MSSASRRGSAGCLAASSALLVVLAAMTAIRPAWIEALVDVSPDGGTGAAEWWLVALLALGAGASALLARRVARPRRG